MVYGAEGNLNDAIRLENKSAKGSSGGAVYMSARLKNAVADLFAGRKPISTIITAKSGKPLSAASMTNWSSLSYRNLGFEGCSSHCGERTAITKWAHTISQHNGSMCDVQAFARHSSLQITQRYVEVSEDAMKGVVG